MTDRDFIGYGAAPPDPRWPGGARVALSFVVNLEEGAETSILDGDPHGETILSDLAVAPAVPGRRDRLIESLYEYGSRVGIWRVLDLFQARGVAPTIYAVGLALARNPAVGEKIAVMNCDLAGHGWRWIDYADMPEDEERADIARTVETIERLAGKRPLGWYTGRPSLNTRRLLIEHGGFLYDCDDHNDDLPFWVRHGGHNHLVVPHSLDNNDSRFSRAQGFNLAGDFFTYMKDGFDWLYEEGAVTPRLMTVSLHPRLIGHPGRIGGLARFLDYVLEHDKVWIAGRSEIARHWRKVHPPS